MSNLSRHCVYSQEMTYRPMSSRIVSWCRSCGTTRRFQHHLDLLGFDGLVRVEEPDCAPVADDLLNSMVHPFSEWGYVDSTATTIAAASVPLAPPRLVRHPCDQCRKRARNCAPGPPCAPSPREDPCPCRSSRRAGHRRGAEPRVRLPASLARPNYPIVNSAMSGSSADRSWEGLINEYRYRRRENRGSPA
jgi:hypothetical protein